LDNLPADGHDERRGPVGRILDLVFLRGTIPPYSFPTLTAELGREILAAAAARPDDSDSEVISATQLAEFLERHAGHSLAFSEKVLDA